jgi:outer membrane lipoprotein-sorting protein
MLACLVGSSLFTARLQPILPESAARAEEHAEAKLGDLAKLTTSCSDLEANVHVTKYDSAELEKIGSEFKTTYSLRNLTMQYKQPDKIRLEGHSPTRGDALMIMNGAVRYFEVPRLKIHKSENLENQPGRRQSLLEYVGLVSPGTLQFMEGKLLREEKAGERDALVYDMHYQGVPKGSYYRVWIDKETHITLKREWFDKEDKLRATFSYLDAREVSPGIWLPTKVEVKNAEGAAAATLSLSDIKVNQGLSDEPFTVTP